MKLRTGLLAAATLISGMTIPAVASAAPAAAPAPKAGAECVDAWAGGQDADGANIVFVTNSCLGSTVGVTVDYWGPDPHCTNVRGMFADDNREPDVVKFAAKNITPADAYRCG